VSSKYQLKPPEVAPKQGYYHLFRGHMLSISSSSIYTDRSFEGFVDDLVITVRENNDSNLSERMQSALNYVIGCCK
jgi:hypothetical protein